MEGYPPYPFCVFFSSPIIFSNKVGIIRDILRSNKIEWDF